MRSLFVYLLAALAALSASCSGKRRDPLKTTYPSTTTTISLLATITGAGTATASDVFPQVDQSTVRYTATVVGRDQGTGNAYTAQFTQAYSRSGSAVTNLTGAPIYVAQVDQIGLAAAGAQPVFVVNGTGVQLQVSGLSGLTISYSGTVEATSFTYPVVAPSYPVYSGAEVGNFSAANYLSASYTTCPSLASGHTAAWLIDWKAPDASGGTAFQAIYFCGTAPGGNAAASTSVGYILFYTANNGDISLWLLNGTSGLTTWPIGAPVAGENALVVWNDGTHLNATLTSLSSGVVNPGAVVQTTPTAAYAAPNSSSSHQMGLWTGAVGPAFTSGAVLAVAALSRSPASNAEALGWGQVVAPTTTVSRYAFPTSLTGDANCTVDWNASRDWDGASSTSTSHGSAAITYTVNGTNDAGGSPITKYSLAEEYLSGGSLTPYVVDSAGGATVSGNHLGTSSLARVAFTTPTTEPQVALAYVGTDTSVAYYNYDQAGSVVDGTYLADLPTSTPGSSGYNDSAVHLVWVDAQTYSTTFATHAVQFLGTAHIAEPSGGSVYGGYLAGVQVASGQTFTTTTPSKRLVAGLDSIPNGYYLDPPSTGLGSLLRAHFPSSGTGGTTVLGWGGYAIQDEVNGNGITGSPGGITALAALIATECEKVASGGAEWFYDDEGVNTYLRALQTPTAWATTKGQLYDAIHARDANIQIVYTNFPQSFYNSTSNSLGYTLANHNSAATTIASGRSSFVRMVDLTTDVTNFTDHVHPANDNAHGAGKWESDVRAAAGW